MRIIPIIFYTIMNHSPYISVITPAYNEADNIVETINGIIDYFSRRGFSYEIIVVDDGSTDKTVELIQNNFNQPSFKLIRHKNNKGKGAAVKTGMLGALGKIRLFMDSDGQISIENLDKFIKNINEGFDIVIGSCVVPISWLSISDYRFFLGSLAKLLIRLIMYWDIKDSQRGFKVFTNKVAEYIFKRQTINRWGFDIEILAIAQQSGLRIKEVPISYRSDGKSRVDLLSYIGALRDLFIIKINILCGKYR